MCSTIVAAFCQPVVMASIQHQQESPIWGVVEKETLFRTKQLNCDTAPLWGSPGPGPSLARQLCSAPRWSAPFWASLLWSALTPVWQDIFCVSVQLGKGKSWWEGQVHAQSQRELTYIGRSPVPGPWLVGLGRCWVMQNVTRCLGVICAKLMLLGDLTIQQFRNAWPTLCWVLRI